MRTVSLESLKTRKTENNAHGGKYRHRASLVASSYHRQGSRQLVGHRTRSYRPFSRSVCCALSIYTHWKARHCTHSWVKGRVTESMTCPQLLIFTGVVNGSVYLSISSWQRFSAASISSASCSVKLDQLVPYVDQ